MALGDFFGISSVLIFSVATIGFSYFSKKFSPLWVNAFKATVSLGAFFVATLFFKDWSVLPLQEGFLLLFFSGLIGLNVGDWFLFKSFQRIGSSRTLMIYSFQPVIMALFAYVLFDQSLGPKKIAAVFVLIACSFVVSYEKYRKKGGWELIGPLCAVVGIILDVVGVLLTRQAFDLDENIGVFEANFYRCLGACVGFIILSRFIRIKFKRRYFRMPSRAKFWVITTAVMGTFVSLSFYLAAIEISQLGRLAAIVGTAPLFTAVFECVFYRTLPSKYLWVALALFAAGFALLNL